MMVKTAVVGGPRVALTGVCSERFTQYVVVFCEKLKGKGFVSFGQRGVADNVCEHYDGQPSMILYHTAHLRSILDPGTAIVKSSTS